MNDWKQFRWAYRHYLAEGNLAEARRYLHMAIERIDKIYMRELAVMYNQLAKVNLQIDDPLSAETAARKSIETEMQFGPPVGESDHLAAYYVMLADTLKRQRRYSQALTALNQGITLYSQHLNDNDELMLNLKELRTSIESDRWREAD